ncbi:hypothetical protein CU097_000791, partial [Rhizopus azygosporus]
MKIISAAFFALGSFMATSTVEGCHLMDSYLSRNCHSDLMDSAKPRSYEYVYLSEAPRCGEMMEP